MNRRLKISYPFGIFLWYALILILAFVMGTKLAHFNFVLVTISAVIMFFMQKKKSVYIASVIWGGYCLFVFAFNMTKIGYMLYDFFTVFFVFSIYHLISEKKMAKKEQKVVFLFFIIYIVLYLLFMKDKSLYSLDGDERYMGIAGGANLSSTIISLMIVYLWEYLKLNMYKKRKQKMYYYFILGLYSFILIASKSRSVLLLLPYFVVESTRYYKKVYVLSIVGVIFTVMFSYYFEKIQESLRLMEDGSFITRLGIYESLWTGIIDNYCVIPEGFNRGNELTEALVGEKYPAHNDILKLWFEWGIGFFFFIGMTLKFLFRTPKNGSIVWILIFVLSTALHNILNSVYVVILLALIINLKVLNKNGLELHKMKSVLKNN